MLTKRQISSVISTEIVVRDSALLHNTLDMDLMSETRQRVFTITLMELFDHEKALNCGRFDLYSKEKQEHSVVITLTQNTYYRMFPKLIEWIAEQSDSLWNFYGMVPHSKELLEIEFSFANLTTATVFKLVWG